MHMYRRYSDESDNASAQHFRAAKIAVRLPQASRRHASLQYTFLAALILISRCENDIGILFFEDMHDRGKNDHRLADKPIFSDKAKQNPRISEFFRGVLSR